MNASFWGLIGVPVWLLLLLAPDGPTLTQDLRRGLIAALDVTEDTLGVDRTIPRRRDRR